MKDRGKNKSRKVIKFKVRKSSRQFLLKEDDKTQTAKLNLQQNSTPTLWKTYRQQLQNNFYENNFRSGWEQSPNFITEISQVSNKKRYNTEMIDVNQISSNKAQKTENLEKLKRQTSFFNEKKYLLKKKRERKPLSNNIITLQQDDQKSKDLSITSYSSEKMKSCILHSTLHQLIKKKQKSSYQKKHINMNVRMISENIKNKHKKQQQKIKIITGTPCRPIRFNNFKQLTNSIERSIERKKKNKGKETLFIVSKLKQLRKKNMNMHHRTVSSPLQIYKL